MKVCKLFCRTNKKIPRGPPSPPAPVMHSPNRKVTVKEQQEWKIPPCVSNWKNTKVRLAYDLSCAISAPLHYHGPWLCISL